MLGPVVQRAVDPLWKKLADRFTARNFPASSLKILTFVALCSTIILFGLQYFAAAVVMFILYVVGSCMTQYLAASPASEMADIFLISGSFMASLWTATEAGLAVAFLFWAVLVNILTINRYKPAFIIIDTFELGLALVVIALTSPAYIPPVVILTGVACLFSAATIAVQENFLKKTGKV